MTRAKLMLLLATTLFIFGCANKSALTKQERDDAYDAFIVENKLERTDKISAFRFDQWTALGRKHLILYRNFNSPFLVTLQRNCFDLDHSFQLAVEHSGGTLNAKFDYVVVPDTIPVRCYIKSIHKITKEQKKQLLAIGEPPKEVKEEGESDEMDDLDDSDPTAAI